ncbi:hypothetical protein OQA88_2092 [Cercophora sp. LCS_1]
MLSSIPTWGQALTVLSAVTGILSTTVSAAAVSKADTELSIRAAVPWQARHRLTSSQYQSTFDSLVASGYRLTYVSGYTINDDPRYAAIWEQTSGAAWVARHGLTGAQYQTEFDKWTSQGYRPRLVNGYTVGGSARYAAIWDKSPAPGAWVARHGLTSAQYQAEFDKWTGQGYRPVHVSGYSDGGQARYAAIWEKTSGPAWAARHGLTSAQYQSTANTLVGQGYRIAKVSGYTVNGVDFYAAIFDKAPTKGWVARHGLTSAQYQAEFDKWVGQGYKLTVVSGYTLSGSQDRYAAVWEQQ